MGGWDGRCRLLRLHSFFFLFLTVIPSPETYLAAENIHNRRQLEKMLSRTDTNAPQLMDSQALLYSENKTHTHTLTLWLCKSCERRSTGSISPSFRCVRLLVGSLECLCWGVSHVGESGRLRHMWTLLCLVDMFLFNTTRFVLFVVCAEERWDIFLRANLRCCYIQSLKSDMFEEKHSMLTLASLSFSCLFTVLWRGLI